MKELRLRKESLLVRNDVIKLIKEVFGLEFNVCYNDLYWKGMFIGEFKEVRRLKGYFSKDSEFVDRRNYSVRKDKFLELKKFINEYNFGEDFNVDINILKGKDYERYDWNDFYYIIKIEYKDEKLEL